MNKDHFISGACKGEKCRICGEQATHKVGEEIPHDEPPTGYWPETKEFPPAPIYRHNFTAYVCCKHFTMIFGGSVFCERQE